MRRLLLISSSRTYGTQFLEHCSSAIGQRLGETSRVLFIPYALHDHQSYARIAREAFASLNCDLQSLHEASRPADAVRQADAIFVGGGNTFRLLSKLYAADLVSLIRQRVQDGVPYLGSSAGSVIAGPSLRTTNDMPIVEPPSFVALNLVPFQINPHYLDADPASRHQGETRETRLAEFLEENDTQVLAIREGCWLMVDDAHCQLGGTTGAVLFEQGRSLQQIAPGSQFRVAHQRLELS